MPRERYETSSEIKYTDLMEFTDAGASKRFRDQVMQAVDDYIQKNGDLTPEDVIKENDPYPF